MARYTAKFAHLESLPTLKEGQIIKRGEKIGRMGNTGKSFGAHLHFDLIDDDEDDENYTPFHREIWRLSDIKPSRDHAKQSAYFIDNELFKTEIEITTYYCDPRYYDRNGKLVLHPAYDVIPKNRESGSFDIYWNRSMPGQVLKVTRDFDDLTKGYGYTALIGFDA